MDVREIIWAELQRQKMTQSRLAELADMTEPRVSDFLSGKRGVNSETLVRMLEALNLTIVPRKGRRRNRKGS